jgi:hypothetical protein
MPTFSRTAERFLSEAAGTLWRATAGACGVVETRIERSDDGGRSWTDVTPRYLGIAQVASLDAPAAEVVGVVAGVGPDCGALALRSYTNGEFWEDYPDLLPISRHVNLSDPSVVQLESGPVAAPCAVAHGMRALRQTVALICDGTAYVWREQQWAALPGADAAAVAISGSDVISAHVAAGCKGLTLTRFTSGDPSGGNPIGCLAVADAAAPAALVASGNGFLLWSGDELLSGP